MINSDLLWYASFLRDDIAYIERDIKENLESHLRQKIREMRSTLDMLEKNLDKNESTVNVETIKKSKEHNDTYKMAKLPKENSLKTLSEKVNRILKLLRRK